MRNSWLKGAVVSMACVAALAAAGPAPALISTQRFTVSPALEIAHGRPPGTIAATTVSNTTPFAYRVTVKPVRLRQELSGLYTYRSSKADLAWASRILHVDKPRFVLGPGKSQQIAVEWRAVPLGEPAVAVGIAVLGTPTSVTKSSLGSRAQVVRLNFLTLPKVPPAAGTLPLVEAAQNGPRRLQIQTRVRNTGKSFATPLKGMVVIRHRGGSVVQRSNWSGLGRLGWVIPGAQRDYPLPVRGVLPAGAYVVDSYATIGRRRHHVRGSFRLVGPNELPTPAATVVSLNVTPNPGEPKYAIAIRNTGNVPLRPEASVTLQRMAGDRPGAVVGRGQATGVVAPGKTTTLRGGVGNVDRGDFLMRAVVRVHGVALPAVSNRFTVQPKRSAWQRFSDWLSRNGVLAIGIAAAILLALLLVVIASMRKRYRRRLQEAVAGRPRGNAEPARSRTPARRPPAMPEEAVPQPSRPEPSHPQPSHPSLSPQPDAHPQPVANEPAPPSDGLVSLNDAAIEDLMRLPGIGRRAAERIVEHRERNGPFATVEDLSSVEGFHSERVARMRPHVRL